MNQVAASLKPQSDRCIPLNRHLPAVQMQWRWPRLQPCALSARGSLSTPCCPEPYKP